MTKKTSDYEFQIHQNTCDYESHIFYTYLFFIEKRAKNKL